jgi:hypothetical protein
VLRWAAPRYAAGTARITVEVDDGAATDNVVQRSFNLTWTHDVQAPQLACPDGMTVPAESEEGTRVEFQVSATDASGGEVEIECTPASGSLFPPGTTEVVCMARDACGNMSLCRFEVTVWRAGLWLARGAAGEGLEVIWEAPDAILLVAEDAEGPWQALPEAVSPHPVKVETPRAFYQLGKSDRAAIDPSKPLAGAGQSKAVVIQ